ncbi:MAG: BREX-1 system adenine-specific DNA-methyltransferase PglX, partial [Chloroflexales bacterium]|nr:BREX-1 system adenine-specific DNA-methyltransferase PglX [Chloroflexales bacterium]
GEKCIKLKALLVASDVTERTFLYLMDLSETETVAAVLHTLEGINEREVFAAYGVAGADMHAVLDETGVPAGWFPLLAGYDVLPQFGDQGAGIGEQESESGLPTMDQGQRTIELPPEVLAHLAAHERIAPAPVELQRIKARLRALYAAGPGAKTEDEAAGADGDDAGEATVSGAHIPIPTETFLEELSVNMQLHPISVYWLLEELRAEGVRCKPEEQRLQEDRLSVIVLRLLGHRWPQQIEAGELVPDWADADGIIPISGGAPGRPTLTERVRARLRAEDGDLGAQRAEALLHELTGQSLEEWLRRAFFKRHVRQFKHRPIAWHFASDPAVAAANAKAKKRLGGRRQPAFECMVYYHACGGDILARIRTQYVEPLLRGARQEREQISRSKDETGVIQATLRIQELEEFNRRLQQVAEHGFASPELDPLLAAEPLDRWSGDGCLAPADRDELQRQEQAWRVDLNDGVRVNIAPLQLTGLLASDVLKAADARKALADRARWRSDERRWVRAGKLPRCGWMPEAVPESLEWTRLASQREAERAKLEEKRRAVRERREHAES